MDYPYGLTWVSTEPWGYAPYHYGRWTYMSNDWFWVPESTYVYPTYSPALTAFIPMGNSSFAWIALGPGDPYVPRYYDPYWQPVYLTSQPAFGQLANIYVPNAVTVVPVQYFGQVIDPRVITRVDPQTVVQYRPVLDPLTVDPLRQAAFATRQGERRVDIPQSVAQRITNTTVIASAAPAAPPFKRDLASALHVQQAPGRARNQKLQMNDQRAATAQQAQPQGQAPNVAAEQAREKQMADLARQAARGDRGARQQMQQLRQQQITEQRAQGAMNPQVQGQRVGQPAQQKNQGQLMRQQQQSQREAARQQMTAAQQPQRSAQQQRLQNQRAAPRQPQIQRAPAMRSAPQAQPVRPQAVKPQPQRKPEVQYQRPQAQPRVMSAPRSQPMPQARPQVERRGPPVQRPQPQAAPRPQPQAQPRPQPQRQQPQAQPRPQAQQQPRPQPQAQPNPQPQGQSKGQPQGKPKDQPQGNPRKKP